MTTRTLASLLLTLALLPCVGWSQSAPPDTLELDLERAVDIALNQSPEAFNRRIGEQQVWLGFRAAAIDMYSPQLSAELGVPSFSESLVEQFVFDPITGENTLRWVDTENRRWLGDLVLDQPLPTGGRIRLESTVYRRFYGSDITDDEVEYSASYRLSFSQELLRGNLRRYAREQAELAWETARLDGGRARQQLIFSVMEAYYGLVASQRELAIVAADLEGNRETADLARRKYEAGLIPEVEALQLEVEAARVETDLLSTRASHEGQLDRFLATIGLELDQPVLLVGQPEFDPVDVVLDSAVNQALKQREDVRISELAVEQSELAMVNAKRPWRIGGQLSAFYNLDRRTDELNAAFSADYGDYFVNRGFAFNVSIPLFSGGRRNLDVQSARLQLRRAEHDARQTRNEIVLDVRSAVRGLREARSRYEISRRSLAIAETSFEISRDRFENGQITAREWIDAQISVNRSRISTTRALMDHNIALARYRLAIGDAVLPGRPKSLYVPDWDDFEMYER